MKNTRIPALMRLSSLKCEFTDGQRCDFTHLPRPFYVIAYINRGTAVYNGCSGTVSLTTGDLLFIPQGETYESYWYGAEDMYCTSIFFSFMPDRNPILKTFFPMQRLICTPAEHELILSLNRNISAYSFDVMQMFYQLCGLVFPRLISEKDVKNTTAIQDALVYIHAHYKEHISIKQMSELCCLSESRFCHIFSETMGLPPIAYKNSITVSHAVETLKLNPRKSIEEISSEYGFSSSSYFRRMIKKFTGKSPKQLRSLEMM